ncbi:hypothetical protein GALL_312700 [mine drainage metagenome]|uniref:Uncharacterized protein n=1 Tax=mine drainage metagenome TaxID=410659 RepID=A0A1J5QTS6_9ZZZZ
MAAGAQLAAGVRKSGWPALNRGLRHSFGIKSGKHTQEVGVDAKTGKVLENDREGPNAD